MRAKPRNVLSLATPCTALRFAKLGFRGNPRMVANDDTIPFFHMADLTSHDLCSFAPACAHNGRDCPLSALSQLGRVSTPLSDDDVTRARAPIAVRVAA